MIPTLLDHKHASVNLLIDGINALLISVRVENDAFKHILNSRFITDELINRVFTTGSVFDAAVLGENIRNIKLLLKSSYDLTPSFKINKDGKNLLMYSVYSKDIKIFKLLLESKYMTKEILLSYNKYRINAITHAFNVSPDITKYFVTTKYWEDEEVRCWMDIDGDFLLLHTKDSSDLVAHLFQNNKLCNKMLELTNRLGLSCLHLSVKYNSFEHFLAYLPNSVVLKQDIYGRTFLHSLCELPNKGQVRTNLQTALKSPIFTTELLLIQNKKGQNAIMSSFLHNNWLIADQLINSPQFTAEILAQTDNNGDSTLMYIIRFLRPRSDLLTKVIGMVTKDMLEHHNDSHENPITYCCLYNGDSIKHFLDLSIMNNDMLYIHSTTGSCLTLAARHQPQAVKHILAWPPLEWYILSAITDGNHFVEIGCIYNAESVKMVIESPYDMKNYFQGSTIMLAAKHQPEAVKYILDSQYGSTELLETEQNNRTCINEAYDYQPKSLLYIIDSKYCTHDILNKEDEYGYRLLHKLQTVYSDVQKYEDIKKLKLIEHINETCEENDPMCCSICCTFKTKVVFNPCPHTSCVSCAFKLKKCHICRKQIMERNIIRF
jgi:ankyrin repeat protein